MSLANSIFRPNAHSIASPVRLERGSGTQKRFKRMAKCARYSLFALIAAISQATLADEFPGIEALMSEDEFKAAGLNQLTGDQLQALDRWLLSYTAGASQVLQSNEAVKSASQEFEISSRLAGSFTGWTGDTVFVLENGQRWRQRLSGRYIYQGAPNPAVKITRNFFGYYMMTLIDEGRAVGVSPMQ